MFRRILSNLQRTSIVMSGYIQHYKQVRNLDIKRHRIILPDCSEDIRIKKYLKLQDNLKNTFEEL